MCVGGATPSLRSSLYRFRDEYPSLKKSKEVLWEAGRRGSAGEGGVSKSISGLWAPGAHGDLVKIGTLGRRPSPIHKASGIIHKLSKKKKITKSFLDFLSSVCTTEVQTVLFYIEFEFVNIRRGRQRTFRD